MIIARNNKMHPISSNIPCFSFRIITPARRENTASNDIISEAIAGEIFFCVYTWMENPTPDERIPKNNTGPHA